MSAIVVGPCLKDHIYEIWDADAASETEFEGLVAKGLTCIYSGYRCIVFGGGFKLEDEVSRPDLALIANDYSHWFVIEVELASHSLNRHVLPQVRAFRYGEPQPDCITILVRETGLFTSQVETFLRVVPRSVAVIANKRSKEWEIALASLQVQLVSVVAFKSPSGGEAIEVDGRLDVLKEHLGFGIFSVTDAALRFPKTVNLPDGEVMISDTGGASALWTVRRDGAFAWVTKNVGAPNYLHGSHLQLIRSFGGQIVIKP
jgi:hypothetical protein